MDSIFMDLEQPSQQQQQQQQQFQTPITKYSCSYCHQSRYKSGFFLIFKDKGMKFYCSKKCANYGKKNKRKIICKTCGKSFINLTSLKNRKYCSKPCSRKDQPDRYKIFNWCSMCNLWIRKKESILKKPANNNNNRYKIKRDHYCCPICNTVLRTGKK